MAIRTVFYPNCCHVCKRWDVPLVSCTKCQMISYCKKEHQQEHWPHHKDMCEAITRALEGKEYMNTEEILTKTWLEIRKKYTNKVEVILGRDLKTEESEMFLFPKACVVCHRQDTVIRCNDCPSAAFCDKHRYESEHREKYCELLRETFNINNYLAAPTLKCVDISYVDRLSNQTLFRNMESFLDTYVPLDENNLHLRMLHTYGLSEPLTVYYCIQKLDFFKCETLTIHIIGASVIHKTEDFRLWKMLLSLIPTLTTLTITFIQAERMVSDRDITTEIVNVSETKKLVANVHCMLYEEYVGTRDFKKPNFIVGFRGYVTDYTTNGFVNLSARTLAEQKCPRILVFEYIPPTYVRILNKVESRIFEKNPFKCMLIQRDPITEGIYHYNNYLIIFLDYID